MKKKYLLLILLLLSIHPIYLKASLLKIRFHDHPDFSRVVLESSRPFSYEVHPSPGEITVRVHGNFEFELEENIESRLVKSFRGETRPSVSLFTVFLKKERVSVDHFTLTNPFRLVLDLKDLSSPPAQEKKEIVDVPILEPGREIRQASGKTIIIDPGHGGSDRGAKGSSGLLEKDVSLAIAQKLESIIERNLPFRVVLTRTEDVNLSLEERASLANNQKAELFISIHANASYRHAASGPETYFLSLSASDEEARRLAYFENNSERLEEGILPENEDDLKMILWDLAQTSYLKQSSQLAESIQQELNSLLGTVNRGIKQAPFKVLSNVAMPAILVEVAFISNPIEEKKLASADFQSQAALAIYRGIAKYLRGSK